MNKINLEEELFNTLNPNNGLSTEDLKEVLQRVKAYEASAFASMMQHADGNRMVGLMYIPLLLMIQYIWIKNGHDVNALYNFIFGSKDICFAPKAEMNKVMNVGENIPNYTHVFKDGSKTDYYIPSLKFAEVFNRYTFIPVKPSSDELEIIKNMLFVLDNKEFQNYMSQYSEADLASIEAIKEQCYKILNTAVKIQLEEVRNNINAKVRTKFDFCIELAGWWCLGAVIGATLSCVANMVVDTSVGESLHA